MDINLPKMSGVECVRRLKVQMPETQFVMLTVYEDNNRLFQSLTAGARPGAVSSVGTRTPWSTSVDGTGVTAQR